MFAIISTITADDEAIVLVCHMCPEWVMHVIIWAWNQEVRMFLGFVFAARTRCTEYCNA